MREMRRWDAAMVEKALIIIAKYYGATVENLTVPNGRNNEQRDVAIYIVNKYSGWRLGEIAEVFGISYSAVSKAASRVSGRIAGDKTFSRDVSSIRSRFKT